MSFPSLFSILIGLLMLAQWGYALATGGVPELQTAPWEIAFHLAAEAITALGLLACGVALRRSRPWAVKVFPIFAGMLIYSCVNSAGYFAQQETWSMVVVFFLIMIGALISLTLTQIKGRE